MKWQSRGALGSLAFGLGAIGLWQFSSMAQQPEAPRTRFEFRVVESFNAKYLGDTPGHMGRGGNLQGKPDVALGDPVFHEASRIGTVTGLVWDRTKDSLEVEFDPLPFEADAKGRPVRLIRITVGEDVWIPLGGEQAAKPQ